MHDLELAYDHDGRILALRDRFLVDAGAYNAYAVTVSYNTAAHIRGQYAIDTFSILGRNVVTTKAPVAPVRGAGRPEAVFALDRALDLIASERGLDPAEVRRRNMIPAAELPRPMGMPYRDGAEMVYDSGDYPAQLEQALEAFGYEELRARQAEWRAEGRLVGVGISSYVEGSGFGPYEGAVVRLDQRGHVHVVTGAKPHGQGLETTLAQVCADELGVDPERVTVTAGDTSLIQYGIGTFASRSAVLPVPQPISSTFISAVSRPCTRRSVASYPGMSAIGSAAYLRAMRSQKRALRDTTSLLCGGLGVSREGVVDSGMGGILSMHKPQRNCGKLQRTYT